MGSLMFRLFIFIVLLSGCTDGKQIYDSDLNQWVIDHQIELNELVSLYKETPCLRRVELNEEIYLNRQCQITNELKNKHLLIQAKLVNLGVVLSTSTVFKDGGLNVRVLLYRGWLNDSNKSSAVSLTYLSEITDPWTKMLECGKMLKTSKADWYIEFINFERNCY
jgi:hypothetical protein